jgi:hypothetical protein
MNLPSDGDGSGKNGVCDRQYGVQVIVKQQICGDSKESLSPALLWRGRHRNHVNAA